MERDLLAHGLGGAKDLPISPELAIAGAVAALVVSFTVLALAWRTPRFDRPSGRPAPAWLSTAVDSAWFTVLTRALGLALFGWFVMAAVLGENLLINPALGMFYVLLWVGLVPLSLVFGPAYKALSPVRTLHAGLVRLTGSDPREGLRAYPERLGYWPAALGLFSFVWLELVHPDSTQLGTVRLWVAIYVAVMLLGGAVYGSRFFERADPFEVYSTLVGHLSVWGRRDGELVLRSPLANLATVPALPGLVAVVAVLFGSTGFDSFRESPPWLRFVQDSTVDSALLGTAALVVFCVGVGLVLTVATVATGVGDDLERRRLPSLFAHSMVPIIVGYVVAHYLSYFVEYGQVTLAQMSDPFSQGDNLLGTADWQVNRWLSYHPTTLANIKVLGVVLGHVLGVVAAHDRAVGLLPRRHQLTGQLPLLFAMVGFTAGGLYLLFAA
ncbi:hypothetical protein [Nocardioides campestrisoli]|uniref:hypothetical protein n=1 Tax=Nocardioides campestrisoli TaxID=2736757 RepID=UPI0015E7A946|nr:hypothetical protein [Nocardioides campestrisoli]